MPASLSQISRRGTAPSWTASSSHVPASRSAVVREGIITAVMNFENDATIQEHRQHHPGAVPDRDLRRREPQVALHLIARVVNDPISRIARGVLGSDRRDVLAEP
jgi:hypothetical protein